jgi:hypothetical protein
LSKRVGFEAYLFVFITRELSLREGLQKFEAMYEKKKLYNKYLKKIQTHKKMKYGEK